METTNFFSSMAALNVTGDLQLTICKASENNWIVSVLLNNAQCGDDAKRLIPPLMLKGTAEELDRGFFESIAAPLQTTSGLLINMEAFLKQQEEAKKQSAMQKEKADKERREKEAREKTYKEAMQQVDELEKEGKYRDAWMKVPEPSEYPEQSDAIRKRKSALSVKFSPDLFGDPATTVANQEPPADDAIAKEETDYEEPPETTEEED
jgi:PRTRC genetic system protein E